MGLEGVGRLLQTWQSREGGGEIPTTIEKSDRPQTSGVETTGDKVVSKPESFPGLTERILGGVG